MLFNRFGRTRDHIRRLREIVVVLAKHGFSHILVRIRLAEYAPWLGRVLAFAPTPAPDGEDGFPHSLAERSAAAMEELGPTFVKFGQLLATRPDLVAEDFAAAFARLQDAVGAMPADALDRELRLAFGRAPEEMFAAFDRTPLACGSIAQAHAAVLSDGRRVIVKVKRPNIDKTMREDLRLLSGLARLVDRHLPEYRPMRPMALVEEFSRGLEQELDFFGEAARAARIARDLASDPGLAVPAVIWDHVTARTVVYERLEGMPLSRCDASALADAGIDPKALAATLARGFMRQYFVGGLFHADPHPGNLLALPGGRLGLLDFGQTGSLSDDVRRRLALLAAALGRGDTELASDLCVDLGETTSDSDLEGFHRDLRDLVERYAMMPAARVELAGAINQALKLSRAYGILWPREMALLAKSLATLLGVLRVLDPGFQARNAMRPFVRRALMGAFSPADSPRRLGRYGYRLYSLLRRAPEDMRALLRKTREGNLRIIFSHEGLDPVAERLERAINRLTVGMVAAAILVGCAIVLAGAGEANVPISFLGRFPLSMAVAGTGFAIALGIGLWIMWGVLRKR